MADDIAEIKNRLDIVEVISEYVRLKQSGTNWKGLCPFHNEKTPSFMVSKDKQIWHCFGCSEGGDIFSFIQKVEGLEFTEALRLLAHKAGVTLSTANRQEASQRNRILDICQTAATFWHELLLNNPNAKHAREYLEKRQVNTETTKTFQLGFAPNDWEVTSKFLRDKGFSDQEIFLAGLTVKKDRGAGFYDRFRNRITFPINNQHGNPIGFSARTLDPNETGAKYINTPQTLAYNKSQVLFNLDRAKQEIKNQKLAVIVEGQMDAVSAWQAGTHNVIASSGTALTEEQVLLLKRFTDTVAIAFDADAAGQSAAMRGFDVALANELNVRVIVLPEGKDPDECIKKNPDQWFTAIKEAKSIMDYYFDRSKNNYDITKVEDKKIIGRTLLPVIGKIGNAIEQTHWLQRLGELLSVSENVLRETLNKTKTTPPTSAAPTSSMPVPETRSRPARLAEQLLALLFTHPKHLHRAAERLAEEVIPDEQLRGLYRAVLSYYNNDIAKKTADFDFESFQTKISDPVAKQRAVALILLAEKDFFDFDADTIEHEVETIITYLLKDYYTQQLRVLESRIKAAESGKQRDQVEALTQEFSAVLAKLKILNQ
ncbi:MAG: DNA primase [Candidatus Buchananbacteria bacterium RIFCSPHIGHO2_01_FULL_47_11b]|uniref:DNA primase n=1 Tax=Candidatus Buchananbacteria bacterium RIFCSPHIGHO2_01_FULL_47_11b TaxID=1797537 RepID=A0A1G1Y3H5_9BACT|nr:MAG: DNA primase [Candidatus Buchananbacteria bacterium RIFCSPHIGHO2_01_FULL_47_11b]